MEQTTDRTTGPDRDWTTFIGIGLVGAAAAVMTFVGWTKLGELVGITQTWQLGNGPVLRLSWLLPISVDAYAGLAARVWLRSTVASDQTRRYAQWSSVGAVCLSIAGNGLYHLSVAVHLTAGDWWPLVVVLVSGIPALQLGLALQLLDRVSRDEADRSECEAESVPVEVGPADVKPTVMNTGGATVGPGPVAPPATKRKRTVRRTKKPTGPPDRTDDELLAKMRAEWPERLPSRNEVMKLTSTGTSRADRLLGRLTAERTTPTGQEA